MSEVVDFFEDLVETIVDVVVEIVDVIKDIISKINEEINRVIRDIQEFIQEYLAPYANILIIAGAVFGLPVFIAVGLGIKAFGDRVQEWSEITQEKLLLEVAEMYKLVAEVQGEMYQFTLDAIKPVMAQINAVNSSLIDRIAEKNANLAEKMEVENVKIMEHITASTDDLEWELSKVNRTLTGEIESQTTRLDFELSDVRFRVTEFDTKLGDINRFGSQFVELLEL